MQPPKLPMFSLTVDAPRGKTWKELAAARAPTTKPGSGLTAWGIGQMCDPPPIGVLVGSAPSADRELALGEMVRLAGLHGYCHVSVLDLTASPSIKHAVNNLARGLAVKGMFSPIYNVTFGIQAMGQTLFRQQIDDLPPEECRRFRLSSSQRSIAEQVEDMHKHPRLGILDLLLYLGRKHGLLDRWVIVVRNVGTLFPAEEEDLLDLLRMESVVPILDHPYAHHLARSTVTVTVRELLRSRVTHGSPPSRGLLESTQVDRDRALAQAETQLRAQAGIINDLKDTIAALEGACASYKRDRERLEAEAEAMARELRMLQGKMIIP